MKNLGILIAVALLVLGIVYIVKSKKAPEPDAPAFNSGAPLDQQPPGVLDGTYLASEVVCLSKKAKQEKLPEVFQSQLKIRGMIAELDRKAGHCTITQSISIHWADQDPGQGQHRKVVMKQGKVACAPDCPCHASITGSVFTEVDLDKKTLYVTENTRIEKALCNGSLPYQLKFIGLSTDSK